MEQSPYNPIMAGKVPLKKEEQLQEFENGLPRPTTPRISMYKNSRICTSEDYKKSIGPNYRLRRFYLASEVAKHNTADDCWVSIFHQVFDVTQLIQENYKTELCDPIVLAAGTDISHWFDEETGNPNTYLDP